MQFYFIEPLAINFCHPQLDDLKSPTYYGAGNQVLNDR